MKNEQENAEKFVRSEIRNGKRVVVVVGFQTKKGREKRGVEIRSRSRRLY